MTVTERPGSPSLPVPIAPTARFVSIVPANAAYNNNGATYSVAAGATTLVLDYATDPAVEVLVLSVQPQRPSAATRTYSTATVIVDTVNGGRTYLSSGTAPVFTSQSGQCP